MSGNISSKECLDPFQVFEVEQKPCYKLTVTILRGRNIVEAAKNFVNTPDPYVIVSLSSTLSPKVQFSARTQTQHNEDTPDWNHTFSFFVDLQQINILTIQVYDEDLGTNKIIGISVFNLNKLEKDKLTSHTFTLESKGQQGPVEVDAELLLEEDHKPDLRFSICLCDEEREFLAKRQQHVFESLKTLFGDKAPKSIHDVPGVGVVQGGGSVQGMVASCGVFSGLHQAGLLDIVSYVTGLSASTWYMSHLYAQPDWPQRSPGDLAKELKAEVTSSFTKRLLRLETMYTNVKAIKKKKKLGQAVSFTDVFGFSLGKMLQPNKFDAKLTDQAPLLKTGKVPMPIFTACTVKNDVMADKFHEWVECTAFEVALAKYGIAMKTGNFGSKFFLGRIVKRYQEPPLHFFQGIWGSVWAIFLQPLVRFMRTFEVCCFRKKTEEEVIEPLNSSAACVLTAKKLEADLQERDDEHPEDEDVVTLDTKSDDDTDDSDKDEDIPAWYQHMHHSAEQNARNRQRGHESTPKVKRANEDCPEQPEIEEEVEPMRLLDEIVKLLTEEGSIIGTRIGRAATVFNYLNGTELKKAYPVSPFMQYSSKKNAKNPFPYLDIAMDTEKESICVVDAGVAFKLPFPPLLRPQRNVDVFLSFEFSLRIKDYAPVFKELKSAEAWAKANQVPFPKIDESVYDKEGMKEVYIFQNQDDPLCPVVLHFPLVNLTFKDFKKPGHLRETKEEKEFGDFNVYEDGNYHTLNLTLDERDFDRLVSLMEYNVLNNSHIIKDVIMKRVEMKKQQRQARLAVYEKAINNMANEDCFKQGLCQILGLDSIQKLPSSRKTVVERFMALVDDDEDS